MKLGHFAGIGGDWAGIFSNRSDDNNRLYISVSDPSATPPSSLVMFGKLGGSTNINLRPDK